jgi:membrane protein required for colicin V production
MFIDGLFIVLMIIAIMKGWSNGLIVAIFSFLSIFIGLAAAIKLSAVVAGWLSDSTSISAKWLPVLSFLMVMIGVVFLVRLGARLIEKSVNVVMLGWLNKLAGILLYACLYTIILSVVIFYLVQLHILKQPALDASTVYPFIKNWGPTAMHYFSMVLPFLKDSFADLQAFFGSVADKTQH